MPHAKFCADRSKLWPCIKNKEQTDRQTDTHTRTHSVLYRPTRFYSITIPPDNSSTWTGLSVEELIRMTEGKDKWREYVHDVANPWIEDG